MVVVVGGLQDLSVSPRPFGFETKGFGLRVWGQGLTIADTFNKNHLITCYVTACTAESSHMDRKGFQVREMGGAWVVSGLEK